MSSAEKIGIMGGTFDPIHYGHLFAAESARIELSLARVVFIPSGNPPHKSYPLMASAEDRYRMTELAIEGNPHFEISRIEMGNAGTNYTAVTLSSLAGRFPSADFFLITGLDAALDIPNWYEPSKILSLCRIAVIARPGYIRDKISSLDERVRDSLIILDTGMIDISATVIRNRAARRGSIRYMTPDRVCRYIQENDIYSSGGDR